MLVVMVDCEDAQSAINKGADPNWKDEVSLQLFNSQCCVYHASSSETCVCPSSRLGLISKNALLG